MTAILLIIIGAGLAAILFALLVLVFIGQFGKAADDQEHNHDDWQNYDQ